VPRPPHVLFYSSVATSAPLDEFLTLSFFFIFLNYFEALWYSPLSTDALAPPRTASQPSAPHTHPELPPPISPPGNLAPNFSKLRTQLAAAVCSGGDRSPPFSADQGSFFSPPLLLLSFLGPAAPLTPGNQTLKSSAYLDITPRRTLFFLPP